MRMLSYGGRADLAIRRLAVRKVLRVAPAAEVELPGRIRISVLILVSVDPTLCECHM